MVQIEEGLHQVHAEARLHGEGQQKGEPGVQLAGSTDKANLPAFAKVDKVDGGSPASAAVSYILYGGPCILRPPVRSENMAKNWRWS